MSPGSPRWSSSLSSPLLGLAENEQRLRMDAVVLHGVRGGLALHDLLEGLEVRDLGDERGLLGPVWVPERPNGDAHRPEHFLTLRRCQPMLDIVHFVGDDVGSHQDGSFPLVRRLHRLPPPSANLLLASSEGNRRTPVASAVLLPCEE